MASLTDNAVRFTRSSNEAAAGYASAAFNAYADMTTRALGMWAQAIDQMLPKPEPTSWYRHPDSRPASPPAAAWFGWPQPANTAFPNPFEFWMRAWPPQGNLFAWPMAAAMMGAGWPRDVAYPAAAANLAAMDAVSAATDAANKVFSTYRSEGGHATAQVLFRTDKAFAAFLIPAGAEFFAPWYAALDAFSRSA